MFPEFRAVIYPSLVPFLDCAKRNVGEQGRDDPALRSAVVRAQELIFRQNSSLKEPPDQLHHPSISDAQAQPVHQVMVIDVVEAALNVAFYHPGIRHFVPASIRSQLARLDGHPDMLQGAVCAPSGTKPVRDRPKLRLEDRLQECFDRALDDAIFNCGDTQGSELPWFAGLGNKFASRRTGPVCARAQFHPQFFEKALLTNPLLDVPHSYPVDPSRTFALV
jgi:hypothetical protein